MATIKDIARETGLGLATISKYLNGGHVLDENKAAIDSAVERLGYTVNEMARGLKTARSRSVGVVIPELGNQFIATVITAMEDILRRSGYAALVCDCRTDPARERETVRFLLRKRVDGIINMPVSMDGGHLREAFDRDIPVVLIDRLLPGIGERASAVLVDNAGGAEQAVSLLTGAGHRRIGAILGPRGVFTSGQRLQGYTEALRKSGLAPEEALIAYGDYTVQGGYESMRGLLERTPITAVFVTNYEMTLGAVLALGELGVRVPEQLSVIGFDNQVLSRVIRPPLTTVTQPLEQIGKAAADILLRRFAGEPAGPRVVTLPTGMVYGESIRKI